MVTVYSKNNCVQCKMTKRFLDSNNVEYKEINLDEQPEYIDQVKELGLVLLLLFRHQQKFSLVSNQVNLNNLLKNQDKSFYVYLRSLSFVIR